MGELKFVEERNINRSFILRHFKGIDKTLSEWWDMFSHEDIELNIEGKISRREYFRREKMGWKPPYRHALLFKTSEQLYKALLAIGFNPKYANDRKEHEERHATRIRTNGMTPAFGLFLESEFIMKVMGTEFLEHNYTAFAFPLDWYEVMYHRKISIEEELKQRIYNADIEGKGDDDKKIIKKTKEHLRRYNEIKAEREILKQWKW